MAISIERSVGLGGANQPNDVIAVKRRLIELGSDWMTADGVMGPIAIKAILLFQAIKNGFNHVSEPRPVERLGAGERKVMHSGAGPFRSRSLRDKTARANT